MKTIERLGPTPARVLWVILALVAAIPVGDALEGRSTAVRAVVLVGLWGGWAGGLVSLLVPRSSALTAMRIIVPAGAAAMVASVVAGAETEVGDLLAVAVAALATVAVLFPWVGEAWIDGSSYGSEQRLVLRPPAFLSYFLTPLTWLLVAAGATVGPLLLAAGEFLIGAPVTVVGAVAVWAGVRSLHQLARRWLVMVPAGVVLHDHLVMPEPQLFRRHTITLLGPAEAGTESDDLTAGAPGLALQLDLHEPAELLVRTGGRSSGTRESSSILFTPSRPVRVLAAAAKKRIPVG